MANPQISMTELKVTLQKYKDKKWGFRIAEGLKCMICHEILLDAVQTDCGCRYCKGCIENHLKLGKKMCVGDSEECKVLIETFINDKATNKEISLIKVKCLYDGCEFEEYLKNMSKHLSTCEHGIIDCALCGNKYIVKNEHDHMTNDCGMRVITCPHCKSLVKYNEYKTNHLNAYSIDVCSEYMTQCPYDCEIKEKVIISEHRKSCKNKPNECPFYSLGCNSLIPDAKKDEHMQKECYKHSLKVVSHINSLKDSIIRLETKYSQLVKENSNLISQLAMIKSDTDKKCTEIEKNQRRVQIDAVSSNNKSVTVFRNGKFIWKIVNFSTLKDNAMRGVNITLMSDAFYTSEFGYKMCLKIYPYGDGIGKATHLSVFFVIMRGEFDDLQVWPFKNKVTLTILEDFVKSTNHTDTFKPDARSVCYQQPEEDFNIASGSPKFISFTDLSKFLKKDTLYLQIGVLP